MRGPKPRGRVWLCAPPGAKKRPFLVRLAGRVAFGLALGAGISFFGGDTLRDFVAGGPATPFLAGVLVAAFGGLALLVVVQRRTAERLTPQAGGYMLTDYDVSLGPAGVSVRTPTWEGTTSWAGVAGIDLAREVLMLRFDRGVGMGIPRRAFATPEGERAFVAYAQARLPLA